MTKSNTLTAIILMTLVVFGVTGLSQQVSPTSGGRKIGLTASRYVYLPGDLTAYLEQSFNEFRRGCFVDETGRFVASWTTEPLRRAIAGPTTWSRIETRDDLRLEESRVSAPNGEFFLHINVGSWGLTAFAPSESDRARLLQVARSTTLIGRGGCADCQSYEAEPPATGPTSLPIWRGCALPITGQANSTAAVSGEGLFNARKWSEAFGPPDRGLYRYEGETDLALDLRIACSGKTVAGVTVTAPMKLKGADILPTRWPNVSEFWTMLTRIDRVQRIGLPGGLTNNPLLEVELQWPAYAQFDNAVVDTRILGGQTREVRGLDLWFYRSLSGNVQAIRGPIGLDGRVAVRLDGDWFWTTTSAARPLKVGSNVQGLMAAGPIGGTDVSRLTGCLPD